MKPPLPKEWTPKGIKEFLAPRKSEDKWFECKAFIRFDPRLQSFADANGIKPFADNPFHNNNRVESFWAYRVIESIIALANQEGGLLFLGIGENRVEEEYENCDGIKVESHTFIRDSHY